MSPTPPWITQAFRLSGILFYQAFEDPGFKLSLVFRGDADHDGSVCQRAFWDG